MTLLKDKKVNKTIRENDIGLTIKDGWNFGIGFGLAMTIAVPLILLLLGFTIGIGLLIFTSFGALL